MKRSILILFVLSVLIATSCKEEIKKEPEALFQRLLPEVTGIEFRNDLAFDKSFNIFTYRNFYNGGGVAIGDINKDGLPDIYFTSNQQENKLYLNKGDFKFEDITATAGVAGTRAWSTGVAMTDVNGDGWLDIYVCNSGDIKGDNKQNELFINNGDGTFTERAEEYGLADQGFSTHAVFFDYDKDGDLDVYLLNNSYQSIGSFNQMQNVRNVRDRIGGDKLYRNDNDRFTDVSEQAGIYGSVIGFGLGVTVGDVDNDGWMDIFISNDFFERDYLYINNQDGTFREELEKDMPVISAASMGADMADINNDGYMDIFVTDMLPEDDYRLKQITTFENWDKFTYNFSNGYHYQLTRNMLHLNNGNGSFSDISRLAGVEATDWSWGALIFDMDNDGLKDIFVANGIYQDITDLDYLSFIADGNTAKRIITEEGVDYKALIDPIPINPIANYAFQNQGNLRFKNKNQSWGLGELIHSNGAAYADLNNDGALDLIVNNVNREAFIYRNNLSNNTANRYLKFELRGVDKNTSAIGTRIEIKAGSDSFVTEQMPNRGFQSSVDPVLFFGLGKHEVVDQVKIAWPDGKVTVLSNVKTNQTLKVSNVEGSENILPSIDADKKKMVFSDITDSQSLHFKHTENTFVDFDRDRLTYHMLSTQGPGMASGDINGDGLDDIYMGGAKGQPGQLFIQGASGKFTALKIQDFLNDANSEDVAAIFTDLDGDGDLDLYVASGGNEFSFGAPELMDRIYLNDGTGKFTRATQPALNMHAEISSTVIAHDFDKDGAVDLFVGIRANAFAYGVPASGILYKNDGKGNMSDVTEKVAPELKSIGHITSAVWSDYDSDGDADLIIVGEWMAPEVFENTKGIFKRVTEKCGLSGYTGWWNTIIQVDVDKDGDMDYILGNHGLNSRFKASAEQPVVLYTNDFDGNGAIDHVFGRQVGNKILPYTLKHELVAQMPSLKKKYLKYTSYNKQSLEEVFSADELKNSIILKATYMSTSVLLNQGNGKFSMKELPVEAQFSPVFSIVTSDLDGDGIMDLVLGGNFYEAKPEAGRYDSSYGLFLKGTGNGNFIPIPSRESGLCIRGAVRNMKVVRVAGMDQLFVALNNDSIKVYSIR